MNLLSMTSSVPNQKNVFGASENRFTALNALSDRDSEERIGHQKVFELTNITKSIFFSNSRSYKSITSNVPVQNFGPDVILYETGVRMSSVATADES